MPHIFVCLSVCVVDATAIIGSIHVEMLDSHVVWNHTMHGCEIVYLCILHVYTQTRIPVVTKNFSVVWKYTW